MSVDDKQESGNGLSILCIDDDRYVDNERYLDDDRYVRICFENVETKSMKVTF